MSKRVSKSAVLLALVLACAGLLWNTYPWQSINPDFLFRFTALSERLTLTPEEKKAAVGIVREALAHPEQPATPSDVPPSLSDRFTLKDERQVWVTLYLPPLSTSSGPVTDVNLYRALRSAARRALDRATERSTWEARLSEATVQIDLLQDRSKLLSRREAYLFWAIEPGVDGIILTRAEKQGFQLPSDAITRGILTPRKDSRLKCIRALMDRASRDMGIRRKAWQDDPEVVVEHFRTLSFAEVAPGKVVDLYRSNVLIPLKEANSKRIYQAILDGARWLLDNARPDGKFNYEYYPNEDRYPSSYNAVRHAGTVFGLLELYRYFPEPHILEAARAALPYLTSNIRVPGKEKEFLSLPDGKAYPTGAAALALLAYVTLPVDLRDGYTAAYQDGLGNFLLRMIDERGAVFEGYLAAKGASQVLKEPLYYPGETLLALSRLYESTRNPQWLEGATRIAHRQINLFDQGREADHWVIQGLQQLYKVTGDMEFAQSAMAMADTFIDTQCPPNTPPFPDYFGAYRRENETPRTTRAGSRSEAMSAALRLAWDLKVDAKLYEDSLLYAAKHQIEQQFRPETHSSFPIQHALWGGFRAGLVDNHLRIDFNQHSAVGLIGALEVAVKREGAAPWWKEAPLVARRPEDAASGALPSPPGSAAPEKALPPGEQPDAQAAPVAPSTQENLEADP